MIRYALVCSEAHEFDAWFRSSADFDRQASLGLVACAVCGSAKVERALMAPNVVKARSVRSHSAAEIPSAAPSDVSTVATVPAIAAADPQQKAMLAALVELKRKIVASADYVGDRFAEEARKIHYGEAAERGIYGEATGEDARALLDEGIDVHPLPILPDDRN